MESNKKRSSKRTGFGLFASGVFLDFVTLEYLESIHQVDSHAGVLQEMIPVIETSVGAVGTILGVVGLAMLFS
jgi:hypothetical protein